VPLIDLHTHTHPLSHDSALNPDDLIDAAKRAGLDGVCLTEHDFFWDHDKAAALARRHNFLVIPGIEVNTEWGHILVFGLEKFVYGMHRLNDLVTMVEATGGAMVAAHPYRRQLPFELRDEGDWSAALEKALSNPAYGVVHAIESHNGRGTPRENAFAAALCDQVGSNFHSSPFTLHSSGRTAGSDAHQSSDIGACATEFDVPITGLADLIAELRVGRCRPRTS